MRIKPINKLVRFLFTPILGGFNGITLCPFGIYMDDISNIFTLNHEKIHWRQQIEMLIIPFYIWYIVELLIRNIKKNREDAYFSLGFEKEAYNNQNNLDYIRTRKPYSWLKYLKNN